MMKALARHHHALGARLAPDHIPLDYGDGAAELRAALAAAVLIDRSHEGRILLTGRDRLELVNRMSTNDMSTLALHNGRATIFTKANARILFRVVGYHRPEGLLLISEAGQGAALAAYLRRNIFFGDQAVVHDITATTAHFAMHGAAADQIMAAFAAHLGDLPALGSAEIKLNNFQLTIARRKSIAGGHWILISPLDSAVSLHRHLLDIGGGAGLQPAGSLTYNSLRIRSGRPAGLELSSDYLPLEVGLWDEVSFSKGCYTGQEIIARMESRGRLAKTMVKVALPADVPAPAAVYADDRLVGRLTSSVAAANGERYALAVLKVDKAIPGSKIFVGDDLVPAQVIDYAGVQAPFILQERQGN